MDDDDRCVGVWGLEYDLARLENDEVAEGDGIIWPPSRWMSCSTEKVG